MPETFYQNVATGPQAVFEHPERIYSRLIFRTEAEALADQPAFTLRCTTPISEHDLGYLLRVDSIAIGRLEVA